VAVQSIADPKIQHVWQIFRIAPEDGAAPLLLCDFSSAGNTWTPASAYRVWLPLTP
jgi:hypothetical protein